MQHLHVFDEQLNDQEIIQNCGVKFDTTFASLYLSASYFSFRCLPLAKIIERMENGKNRFFCRSDGDQENLNKVILCTKRKMWTSATRIETIPIWIVCLHLEIFSSEQMPLNGTLKSCFFRF
jgi:hypothetical protein